MINGERVGVSIITCNRPEMFRKCYDSIKDNPDVDFIVIVNDGEEDVGQLLFEKYIKNETNLGVAKSKNKALRFLMDSGCDHIFLVEDDIYVKQPSVFQKYIETSKVSGIQHLNFSQHGKMNKNQETGEASPKYMIDFRGTAVFFYWHCVGAFSYYTRKCLDTVGLMDERYYNAWDHVDHTFMIIKAGMHPPFWNFADIENSWEYLGDEEWSLETSLISSRPDHLQLMNDATKIFVSKHGNPPWDVPSVSFEGFSTSIKLIHDPNVNVLDFRWNEASRRRIQQVREEWEWMISKIERKGVLRNILEIGCYDGGSSWYLNQLAKNMITIDNNQPCRFNPSDLGEHYQYIGGDSHDPTMHKYFSQHKWDFVFIDGDHSYDGVKKDFYTILPYLRKGTPVAFHDIIISPHHHSCNCYVGEFWEELKKEYSATRFEEYKSNTEWAGIGIVWI